MEAADPLEAGLPCKNEVLESLELIDRLSSLLVPVLLVLFAACPTFLALSFTCLRTVWWKLRWALVGSGLKEAAPLVVAVASSTHTALEAMVVDKVLLEMFNQCAQFCSCSGMVEVLGSE